MYEVAPRRHIVRAVVSNEVPGPEAIFGHVVNTGHGRMWTDQRAEPRVVLAETGQNYVLRGDAEQITPESLEGLVQGFLDCSEDFEDLVAAAFPEQVIWPRVTQALHAAPTRPAPPNVPVRRLVPGDEKAIRTLRDDEAWISKTWGGPDGLASSGRAWGAFDADRLVAVACVFFVGDQQDEVGVVTDREYRGRGLSTACAYGVCADAISSGRIPVWTTSPDNEASLKVATKLGFSPIRRDRLHVVGIDVPAV